ncbi:MAG: transglycosylase domain-containing protein, partial [Bacteroidota bacterium]
MLFNTTTLQAAFLQKSIAYRQFSVRHARLFRVVKVLSLLVLLVVLAVITFVASIGMGAFGKIPTPAELIAIQNPVGSEVLSADGVLMGKYYIEDRLSIGLEDISPEVINALVATEDARFFQHTGVDFRSWLRVFFKTVLMKDRASGGGSTLSQQLAKNLYPRRDYDYIPLVINKLREVFIARRMEQLYTKEELLQIYLNTVSFSDNTYGIRVAAKRFFNKNPKSLKAEEAACLIAMLKATSVYHPLKNPKTSQIRRNVVLEQMQRYGYLSVATKDSLQQLPIALNYQPETHNDGLATYFRESLRLELKDWLEAYNKEHKTNYNLYTDGLRIFTTINARMQQMAEKAVQTHLSGLQKAFDEHWEGEERPWEDERLLNLSRQQSNRYKILKAAGLDVYEIDSVFNVPVEMTVFDWEQGERTVKLSPMDSIRYYFKMLNAGFLAMEPQSGYIRAWVGGTNYKYFKYDHVRSERQVGSTFKPLVYAAAIKKGIHPCDYIGNRLVTYSRYENWRPKNADNRYGGYYSMEGALSKSINAITVNLIMRTRADSVAALAQQMGIQKAIPSVPSIALGAAEVPLFDMVNVYGTFANRGQRVQPIYIAKIEDATGKVLLQNEALNSGNLAQPLSTDEADMMNEMLQTTVNRGTGIRLRYRYKFETP